MAKALTTTTKTRTAVATESESRFTADQIDLITRTICKGGTPDEVKLFMYQAEKTGLDPLARQIYAIKRWDASQGREVMGIQTSIDGFRLIAERTGKYAGQVGPFWCGEDGVWVDAWISKAPPAAARVGILRKDFAEPCWGVARFDAYAQRKKDGSLTRMWQQMGDVMVSKCSEALGLRKAFPQELSGLYTSDEMQQAQEAKEEAAPARVPSPSIPPPNETPNMPIDGEVIPPEKSKVAPPKKSPVPSPSTAKPAETAKQEPEKPKRLMPHELIPDENSKTFPSWASRYIAAIANANDPDELHQWRVVNKNNLAKLSKNEENYARCVNAEEQMVQNLKEAKPKEAATDDEMTIAAPRANIKDMPDPESDPEKFVEHVTGIIGTFKDYGAAEDYYNEIVKPKESVMFPPDVELIQESLRRLEEKLAP